ncbi:MAG: DUF1848 domain-containing protein [Leptospirillum sp.]
MGLFSSHRGKDLAVINTSALGGIIEKLSAVNRSLPSIISVSRRTDIPAFYGEWFERRLCDGFVDVPNPFNRKLRRVSLLHSDVYGYVFWSKNPEPFLPRLKKLLSKDARVVFHVTLTGLPSNVEQRIPPPDDVIASIVELSKLLPPGSIIWRFDPMLSPEGHFRKEFRDRFLYLSERLAPFVDRVMVSLLDPMKKTRRNFPEGDLWWPSGPGGMADHSSREEIQETLQWMQEETPVSGRVFLCTEPGEAGIVPSGACISRGDFDRVWGRPKGIPPGSPESAPTRPGCGCDRSIDIGVYDTCPGGCRYCYAVASQEKVLSRWEGHDSSAPSLGSFL